jgi:hypothetical protein
MPTGLDSVTRPVKPPIPVLSATLTQSDKAGAARHPRGNVYALITSE